MNSFTRNGQTVTFTTDEYGALVQTNPFRSSTDGKPIPLLDYEIDGTRIIASNAGIARQAYQQWKTDTDPEDTMNTYSVQHLVFEHGPNGYVGVGTVTVRAKSAKNAARNVARRSSIRFTDRHLVRTRTDGMSGGTGFIYEKDGGTVREQFIARSV